MFDVNEIAFYLFGAGISWLELVCVLTGLASVYLAGRGKVANFYVGYLNCALLFVLFMQKHLYSSMILQPITLALTIYGNWRWTHPKNGEKTQSGALKITTMDWLHRGFWAGMLIFVGMLWGLFLCKAPGFWTAVFPQADPHPYLDAYVTVAMLVAQYLAAKKHIETWVLWLLADASQIALYIMSGMAGLPVVSLAYLVLAIFGGLSWLTEYKKDSTAEIAAETLNRQNADEVTSDNNTTER
jgi:nicotinamide mononucleotide transporter PnuC